MSPYGTALSGYGAGDFTITGVEGRKLTDVRGLTEQQATNLAFHMNLAFQAGQQDIKSKVKSLLGV